MSNPPLRRLSWILYIRLYSTSLEQKLSSSSSVSLKPVIPPSFGLQFLVEKCGIPLKLDSSLAQKLCFDEKLSSKVKSVITFLKSHDFSEAEIAKLIEKRPKTIHCKISSNLHPKIQYLIESGFKGSLLRQIVLVNPWIFSKSLSSSIMPAHRFLRTVLGSDERVMVAIRRSPSILTTNLDKNMKLNIEYLAKQGMPNSSIVKFIMLRPTTMIHTNRSIVDWVEKVKSLGVMPHAPIFLHVLRAMVGLKESTWKRKVEVFKSLGWSEEDVVSTMAKNPLCFSISEDKLRAALDFFVNHMGAPRQAIIDCPVVLMCSLKKRTIPRFGVMKVLEAEKLLGKCSVSTLILMSEEKFVRNFILKHLDRVPQLLETYQCSKNSGIIS